MVKLGSAFSDNLFSEARSRSRSEIETRPWWVGVGRPLIFATILFLGFFILTLRLFNLTVVRGVEYRKLSDENRTRELVRHAPRGLLLDRKGVPLVTNTAEFQLIKPCEESGVVCREHLTKDAGESLMKQGLPPNQFLEVDYKRSYPLGERASHIVGYTGELSAEELASEYFTTRNYRLGDRVGRMGAEAVFNERLRGRDGRELVEVDASGKIIRVLGREPEQPGEDVTLSLDSGLMQAAADAFPQGEKGAIVVSKPDTGEILAMYSSPNFSPDAFTSGLSQEQYTKISNDKNLPLFNRAIGGVYPPGSTFKLVTSIAGLETGAITKQTTVVDNGVIKIGQFSFPNWYFLQYGKTEGVVDLVRALQRSNDIYFYKAGEAIGITKLVDWAHKVGIGKPLGIELSGEVGGLMPDPTWKREHFSSASDKVARNDEWYLGDTYHISIGQGYLLVTPLQVNAWTNVVASGGKLCKPTIQKRENRKEKTDDCIDLGIKKETMDTIIEGMRKACDTGGTGWPLFQFGVTEQLPEEGEKIATSGGATNSQEPPKNLIPVACKTGTAEFGDPKNHTHAWFTAFAPIPERLVPNSGQTPQKIITGEPEISVAVLVEGAGEGSNVAAPIAKTIFEEWFKR